MTPEINMDKLAGMRTAGELLDAKYGLPGTPDRIQFEAKARAWYYGEILKEARKSSGITQQQLADTIGKKREYIALIEKGRTDMQLSTFIQITEALGLSITQSR